MKKKKISQQTRRQLREIRDFYYRLGSDTDKFDSELDSDNQKALDLIAKVTPGAIFYSMPASHVTVLFLAMIGVLDQVIEVANSTDPVESFTILFKKLYEDDFDEEDQELMESFTDDEMGAFFALIFTMLGNIEGYKAYHRPVSVLVEQSKSNDRALFEAVSIDRSVVSNPVIAKRICIAERLNDESFMNRLAKAITKTMPRRIARLDDFRCMAEVLNDMEGLDTYSYEELADLFINELGVFQEKYGGDGTAAIKKLLQRRKKAIGT